MRSFRLLRRPAAPTASHIGDFAIIGSYITFAQ